MESANGSGVFARSKNTTKKPLNNTCALALGVIKSGPRKGRFLPNKMYKFSHLPQ
jgi:hypothetical protein